MKVAIIKNANDPERAEFMKDYEPCFYAGQIRQTNDSHN